MAVGDTQIDPADLEHSARRMDELADDLEDANRPAYKLVHSDVDVYGPNGAPLYPCAGSYAAAETFHNTYNQKIREMSEAFQQLRGLLRALGDATREVAKRYRTAEEFNSAKSRDIEALLGAATPPDGGQTRGGDQQLEGDQQSENDNPAGPRPE